MDCHVVELETECVPKRTCRNDTQEAPKSLIYVPQKVGIHGEFFLFKFCTLKKLLHFPGVFQNKT